MRRLRIGIIYGGRSSEHAVSLASAAAIFANLDRERYEPVPIRIEQDGRWVLAERPPTLESAGDTIARARLESGRAARATRELHLVAHPGDETMLTVERGVDADSGSDDAGHAIVTGLALDLIFPIVHGPYGEDGTLQGLLELADIPYVGAGVLAAAVGMDKAVMKVLFAASGLPIVQHDVLLRRDWQADRAGIVSELTERLRFPLFVKPANLGSSVGISRATDRDTLSSAIDLAAEFDRKIVVEEGVTPCREIECAVLGNSDPEVSVPGEIIPSRDFYDYEAKYLDDSSEIVIPAVLTPGQTAEVQRLAIAAFRAIDGAGMARVDLLLKRNTGRIFLNEINTHPGFTTISMYSKMWAASGLSYPALLDRLIALANERHTEKQESRTSVL
ncbi:MAG: D-alanine--D-alanine ligase [Vicinamibacterales bacterium]|nr:D-alanine--D-alanine ligase [Vicinamibacterales bacterium]HIM52915.1 D-alanine--D-alanine ligase [Acidobacteriota bacterium]